MKEGYYSQKESVEEYIHLAKDVNGIGLIQELKKHLPNDSTVLEIGSGPGSDWEILTKSFKTIGSDNSQAFLKHLYTTFPEGTFKELDAIQLNIDAYFDAIYSNKVLHHLNDAELMESIHRQTQVLNANGLVCHSFWNGEGSEIFKGLFVNYHSENDLKKMFESYFKILYLEPYKEFEIEDSLLLIGKKLEK